MLLTKCWGIVQYFQYSIHSKDWLLVEETFIGQNQTIMLIWCLKQFKDLTLTFSINKSFFSEK